MEENWGVNDKLLKTLKKHIDKIVAEEYREDAMYVLTNCTDKTIREFLHFSFLENYNLACTCLDFAYDKETGEHIETKTFGANILNKKTLDEIFTAHTPEDFIDEDYEEEIYSPYCPICSGCGEEGCCSPLICKQSSDGSYCESYLNDLKFGYLMYDSIFDLIPKDDNTQEKIHNIWKINHELIYKKDDKK